MDKDSVWGKVCIALHGSFDSRKSLDTKANYIQNKNLQQYVDFMKKKQYEKTSKIINFFVLLLRRWFLI